MAEVEETIKRIMNNKGVIGVFIMDREGRVLRSTMDNQMSGQYSGFLQGLADKAKHAVKEMDSTNDLTFVRIRSKKHEIMVAPDKDYSLVVIQNPNA